MEILIIIGLVLLVALVVIGRRLRGQPPENDLSAGNPPSSRNIDDI
ncbi:hypothetical protein [Nocardia concava]|nr:hypothetical protein [Nocardia concava]